MSYCRFGEDSDIYLIADIAGGWTCYGQHDAAAVPTGFRHKTRLDVFDHLQLHRLIGDRVPVRADNRLRAEMREAR
jgi:hypothetical protein